MHRSSREPGAAPSEVTVDWMRGDIAARCRSVLDALAHPAPSAVHLGGTAMVLRGAADDLVSLVELIEGPAADPTVDPEPTTAAFGLTFQAMLHDAAD